MFIEDQKMTKEQIILLIERMNTVENVRESSDSISWKAHREAETLADVSLFPLLQEIICENSKPKEKKIRGAAYFILGKLLINTFDKVACEFFVAQLMAETDKYIIASMLDRLADIEIPSDISIEPLIYHSRNEKWLIRHSAILALGSSKTQKSKEALAYYLNLDDEKAFKQEIIYASASLGRIGELSDIPLLEKYMLSRSRDVKISAQFAIDRIRERKQ